MNASLFRPDALKDSIILITGGGSGLGKEMKSGRSKASGKSE